MPAETMTQSAPPTYQPMYPVPHPATIGLPAGEAHMVLAGYQDCTAEAIRFLVEVEHISPDDPIVVGLKHHLYQCQRQLDYNQLLRYCDNDARVECGISLNDSGISELSIEHDEFDDQSSNPMNTSLEECEHSEQNIDNNHTLLNEQMTFESLQNSNPAISALAEELLFLLEEDMNAIDDDEDDDDDDYNVDVLEQ